MRKMALRPFTLLVVAGLALGVTGVAPAEETASSDKLGKKITPVTLSVGGKPVPLFDVEGRKALVVTFLSFDCPVSNSYAALLGELHKKYAAEGVGFVGVTCNPDEDAAHVAEQAKAFALPFPVHRDDQFRAAEAVKATVTPEAFVLDHNGVLRYRGRIDNAWAARLKKNQQTTSHELRDALDALLAGKPVPAPVTQAVGCPVPRPTRAAVTQAKVTYYRDVAPILQTNCQGCHRPGEVGPFPLMTYRHAVNWAPDIKDYTQERRMPPWKPVAGHPFTNERRLSDADIATLAAWVDAGTPEGDPKDAPAPRQYTQGWQLGQPDLVLTPNADFELGASGPDRFRCFVLPTNLTEDKYVTAVEVRPGNPRVVHHGLLFIDTTGQGRKLEQQEKDRAKKADEKDRGPGYSVAMGVGFVPQGSLSGWAPGQMPRYLPPDTGYFLPKGSDVIVQLHYHRDGRAAKDRTQIGLHFAKKPVAKRFQGLVVRGNFLFIPKGEESFKVAGKTGVVNQDCTVHTIMPHMHMLGKTVQVRVVPPDGPAETLIAIKEWDYNWQETYVFKEPLKVKAGTRFEVDAVYDNSDKNPNNPSHPPRPVIFGEQTTDEMCFVFLGVTSEQPGRVRFENRR